MNLYTGSINDSTIVYLYTQKYEVGFYNSLYKLPSMYRLLATVQEIYNKFYR